MKRGLKYLKKPLAAILLCSLLVFLLVWGLQAGGRLIWLELAAYDWFIRLEPKLAGSESRITFIEICEEDIRQLRKWPLTDEVLVRGLKIMLKDNPCAIGLDIYRDIPVGPGRNDLNDLFIKNPKIIGVMLFGGNGVPPLAAISKTDQIGFSDIVVDPDGIVRKSLIFQDDGKNVYYSFAFRLASLYLKARGITPQPDPDNQQYIRLKNTTIIPFEANDGGYVNADASGYQFLMDFKDTDATRRSYSFSQLLAGKIPKEDVANKIVLIGVNTPSVKDHFNTPTNTGFDKTKIVPGVVLHGHIVSQLLRFGLNMASTVKVATGKQKIVWLFFWSLAGGLIGLRAYPAWRFTLMVACGMIFLCFTAYGFFLSRWWIPLVPPGMAFFMSAVGVTAIMSSREKKERALLMQLFSRHVSKEIAEVIWEQREQFINNGLPRSQKMMVTAFFSDIKGFTTAAEKMDPQDLIDWLNSYMEVMTKLIMDHGGVVDDYAGDGIKADFGVPIPRENDADVRQDAVNAIKCSLAMKVEMDRLNDVFIEKGLSTMGVRIGIFTGMVVAGLLGSSQRFKYTTIGDTVNIAARLESYNKDLGKDDSCRILIGDTTLSCLGNSFETEKIGEVSLKGKDERVIVHRVLGEK